ncbi:hypothetical protein PTKIN_Ptkin03bG0155500 [Pterospermum kingtungense]
MSPTTVTYTTTAFFVACGFLLLAPALAAPPPLTTIPLPPLFGQDQDVQTCLTTIQGVPGCLQEVITSTLSLQFQLIGSACCKTLLDIEDKCLSKIFPFFVPLLKNQCTTVLAQAGQSPQSSPASPARKVLGNPNK